MTIVENIQKFEKIVASLKSPVKPVEIARAVCIADTNHLNDQDRGKFEHLSLAGLADAGIPTFKTVCKGCNGSHSDVSDVMQMRIMCDVLTLILDGDNDFAMKYSADVAKAMGLRQRTRVGRYAEYDECEDILNSYCERLASYDEYLKPVFERTSFYLGELKRLQPKINSSKSVIKEDCVKDVWLPSEFNAHGFKVVTKEPAVVTSLVGDKTPHVVAYNMAYITEVLIKVIVRVGTDDIAKWTFLERLQEIGENSPDCFPIGVDLGSNIRPPVYMPFHFLDNQALRNIYNRHFTVKKKLTTAGVDDLFKAICAWYGIGGEASA